MNEDQKFKEQNEVLAEYLKTHDLSDNELKELNCKVDFFFLKVLCKPAFYDKVMQEVYNHLRNT